MAGQPIPRRPNALVADYEAAMASGTADRARRDRAVRRYAFAIPDDAALEVIARVAPNGVVEVGAGTGYWAAVLADAGVDVVAYDPEPPPSAANEWFAGSQPWHRVHRGDHTAAADHPDRVLLIVWPTRNETWPADALEAYREAGGRQVVYVGERPGGRTGDDRFHALLGEVSSCMHCTLGVATCACTCGIPVRWQRVETVPLPSWPGFDDRLHVYAACDRPDRGSTSPARRVLDALARARRRG